LSKPIEEEQQVAAQPLNAPRVEVHLVEDMSGLEAAIADLSNGEGALAVDAERASGFKYSQAAYLVQLHRRGSGIYLLDPQAALASDEARQLLANFMSRLTWILHASTQDLPCLNELGLHPAALIDTELGSRLAGLPRVGLGAVVEHFLGLKLAKEHSAVDWSTRPLPKDWLDYAALDVDVLPDLADELLNELRQLGKEDIAAAEFANLLKFTPKEKKIDRWRATTGAHEIKSQRGLAIVRELWNARELLAQRLDVSPGRLIPDASISAAAKLAPRTKSELAGERTFHGRASRTYIDTWWAAIQTGMSTNDLPPLKVQHTGIPNHRMWSNKFPDADARLKAVRPVIAELSEQLAIPAENILTPDYLRQLCWTYPELEVGVGEFLLRLGARQWQVDLVSEKLKSVLNSATSSDAREARASQQTAEQSDSQ
jgi:ribonuclease D